MEVQEQEEKKIEENDDKKTNKNGEQEQCGDEDWDVEEVRGDHESDEHWDLRRNFLIKNKGLYPKLRLLSLSQVFANHEFLGCR